MPHRSGFTLIELSIVLVIIGLIVGGVMVGRDLIKTAETLSMARQIEQYKSAINSFRLKYNALPGDMKDAESYWGTASNCNWGGSTDSRTCNGNGDGLIGTKDFRTETSHSPYNYEYYTFWQHLSNSQLIGDKFSGGADIGGGYGIANPGVNVPTLRNGSCLSAFRWDSDPSSFYSSYYSMEYRFMFHVGNPYPNDVCYLPAFTPAEALIIDTKLDDGLPAKGSIVTLTPNWSETSNCATTLDSATARYKTGYTGIACNLLFIRISE